jgi:N-acetylglutamate synthase-like GNAT family acetyltransferase
MRVRQLQVRAPRDSAEWEAYYDLRWRVLRAPWGRPRGSERDAFDATATHLMVCDQQGAVLGVGRLQRDDDGTGQLRYMAVATACQGRGIGSLLLEALEREARAQGLSTLLLHARENAVPFYAQRGYRLMEPSHLLFGSIQHYKMEKRWQISSA